MAKKTRKGKLDGKKFAKPRSKKRSHLQIKPKVKALDYSLEGTKLVDAKRAPIEEPAEPVPAFDEIAKYESLGSDTPRQGIEIRTPIKEFISDNDTPNRGSRVSTALRVAAGVILLIIIGLGAYYYFSSWNHAYVENGTCYFRVQTYSQGSKASTYMEVPGSGCNYAENCQEIMRTMKFPENDITDMKLQCRAIATGQQ